MRKPPSCTWAPLQQSGTVCPAFSQWPYKSTCCLIINNIWDFAEAQNATLVISNRYCCPGVMADNEPQGAREKGTRD